MIKREFLTVLVLTVLVLAAAACSVRQSGRESDWERGAIDAKAGPREAAVALPPYPQDADLLEFFPGPTRSHHYFIDAKALTIGADGVLRYTVVVRTTGGASNVTHEGMRCTTYQKRIYAFGQTGQKWIEAKHSDWEPIRVGRINEYQALLYADYFCPDRTLVRDRDTALRALRAARYEYGAREHAR